MDPTANNYNPLATLSDGEACTYDILGCTDPLALNYDPLATQENDSCVYAPITGCTDPTATNYNPAATVDDGSCVYAPVSGCTDPLATNYDPNATVDDGSCVLPRTSFDGCGNCSSGGPPIIAPDATFERVIAQKFSQFGGGNYGNFWGNNNPVLPVNSNWTPGTGGWNPTGTIPNCGHSTYQVTGLKWLDMYSTINFVVTSLSGITELPDVELINIINHPIQSLDLRCQSDKFYRLYGGNTEITEIWMPWNLESDYGNIGISLGWSNAFATANPGAILVIHCAHPTPNPDFPTTADRIARVQLMINNTSFPGDNIDLQGLSTGSAISSNYQLIP